MTVSSWVKCPVCGEHDGAASENALMTDSPINYTCKRCGVLIRAEVFDEPTFRTVKEG